MDLTTKTTISVGVAARDLALGAFDVVSRAPDARTPLDLVRDARALRHAARTVEDRAVLAARARGCTWEDVAACIEKVYDQWAIAHLDPAPRAAAPGTANDPDPEETALDLDVWCLRLGARSNYMALPV